MRTVPVVLWVCLLSSAPLAAAMSLESLGGDPALERYLVGFHDDPGLKAGDSYAGARVVGVNVPLRFAVVEPRDAALFEARARGDPAVRYVEWEDPEFARALFVPNDARYGDAGHYGSKVIGAEQAWDVTRGSAAVKVAVIDSGLRKSHEEFTGSGRVLQGYDFVSRDTDPNDNCGHGTHVAGTIGATIDNGKGIAGMAQVTLLPLRALSATLILCTGATSDLADALQYAADQGAHFSSNSWGGGASTAISDAIAYAHARGVVHVAAAGNDGSCANCVSEPWRGNADKVIVVSSTTASDGFSSFSSQGPQVDVAAPGSDILSSYNGNDASYALLSGTSMATPHVTGTAALLKTVNPSWGYAEIDQRLKATAKDLGAAGKDDRFGYGRVDAAAAVGSGGAPGNQPPSPCFSHVESGLATSVEAACSADADGSIVSYAWTWGDGASGSGASATHTYAASGTYTVTLSVTDDDGATSSTSQQVSVSDGSDPDPGATTLQNGVAHSATSGGAGTDQFYKIQVPAGASRLDVVLDGPACGLLTCSVDLDLYVKRGARPTDSSYDCRPYAGGSDESCAFTAPAADWWYVRVDVFSGSNGAYTLRATYS